MEQKLKKNSKNRKLIRACTDLSQHAQINFPFLDFFIFNFVTCKSSNTKICRSTFNSEDLNISDFMDLYEMAISKTSYLVDLMINLRYFSLTALYPDPNVIILLSDLLTVYDANNEGNCNYMGKQS